MKRKNKAQKPQKQQKQTKSNSNQVHVNHKIPQCTLNFAKALVAPFGTYPGVCLPHGQIRESVKAVQFARGNGYINTLGHGAVVSNAPLRTSDSAFNTVTPVAVTKSTGTVVNGTVPPPDFAELQSTTATNFVSTEWTSNFSMAGQSITNADLVSNNVKTKPVLVALRVRFAGRRDDMGGIIFGDFNSTRGILLSADDLYNRPTKPIARLTDSWFQVVWTPQVDDHCSFGTNISMLDRVEDDASLRIYNSKLGIFMNGTPGSRFEWEYVAYTELRGLTFSGAFTPSEGDQERSRKIAEAVADRESDPVGFIEAARKGMSSLADSLPEVREVNKLAAEMKQLYASASTLSGVVTSLVF